MPWWAESLTYCSRGMLGTRFSSWMMPLDGAGRRLRLTAAGVVRRSVEVGRLGVELHDAVEERDLQVEPAAVGMERDGPDRAAHAGESRLGELALHVPALEDLERVGVDVLQPAVGLDGLVEDLPRQLGHQLVELELGEAQPGERDAEQGAVGGLGVVDRGVHATDRRVQDPVALEGVVALVRRLARREGAEAVAHLHSGAVRQRLVDHRVLDHLLGGRVRDQQPAAVVGDLHVVGAVAVHLLLAHDRAGQAADRLADVDPHDVGEARPRHGQVAAVHGGEHVVDVLVVALARGDVDREEEHQADRVGEQVAGLLGACRGSGSRHA